MGWAAHYIEELKARRTVSFRPRGNSMAGKVESGQLCTLEPVEDTTKLDIGAIVLCKVRGKEYLHLVHGTRRARKKTQYMIGNTKGLVNGWIGHEQVYGILTKVEP
jgi:hypothetical protein